MTEQPTGFRSADKVTTLLICYYFSYFDLIV